MADDVTTKILEVQVNYGDALTKIAQYRIEIDKIKEKQKELKEQVKQGQITEEEYHKAMESSKQVMSRYSNSVSVLSKHISNQLKVEKEQDGSLVQLRAKLSDLTAEYDRLSKAEREGAKGTDLKKKMNELTDEIKGLEEATQRYYRNVGNYPKTMSTLGDQLDIYVVKLKEMQAAHQEGTPEFEAMAEKAEKLRETLATASEEGGTSMGDLGDQIATLGMGFNAWTDILDKAGLKNAEVEKTMSQMMVVITAAGTALKIYNAFQKESALYTTALQVKTMLLNTSLGKYIASRAATTAAEVAGTTATGAATTATTIFNAVLYANPLVWLIGIIAAAVAAIYGLVKAFQFFTSSTEEQKEALKEEGQQLESLQKEMEKTRAQRAAMGATSEEMALIEIKDLETLAKKYSEHFDKIAKLYDEDDDEYKEALESKKKAQEDFEASMENHHNALLSYIQKYNDKAREKEIGTYAFKKEQAEKDYDNQVKLVQQYYQRQKNALASAKQFYLAMSKVTGTVNQDVINKLNSEMQALDNKIKSETDALAKARDQRIADAAEEEKKRVSSASSASADAAKKAREEERKREEEYEKEFKAAQDALLAIVKDGLDKQLQAENLAYERQKAEIAKKRAAMEADTKSSEEYKARMRQVFNDQEYALQVAHERRVSEFQYSEAERRIKVEQELLQSKLEIVKKGTEEEMAIRMEALEKEEELARQSIEKRVTEGQLTEEQGRQLLLDLETRYLEKRSELATEYEQLENDRQRAELENRIASLENEQAERELRQMEGYEMDSQQYAEWRQRNLAEMDEHQREILLRQEQAAQQNLDSIIQMGQLESETTEEYNARVIAARKAVYDATKNTNAQIVANEQAKAQAMKTITSSLTSMLDTLGEDNEAFAKMSKIITLAQIAIDTGKALSAGIASASSMPFPANIAAIATTVATIMANVATAISTVKSAKFAQGGKVKGPGTGTSDSIPAMLSNGEFVMTANATRMFEPVLMAMNNIGKGVPMQVVNSYREVEANESLTNSFETAAKEIRPVVSVVEITEAENRVETIESLDTY